MRVYHQDFTNEEDMIDAFGACDDDLAECTVLYAEYTYENYEGQAFVVYEKEGKVYEVNGGHCSCYGLEGQWEPEETTVEALLARPNVPEEAKANIREHFRLAS